MEAATKDPPRARRGGWRGWRDVDSICERTLLAAGRLGAEPPVHEFNIGRFNINAD